MRVGSNLVEKTQLQAAREAAGLSIEQVAKKTNIRNAVIADLEKNSVEVSGGIAYARGHIRSIARVIKADGDLLVSELEGAQNLESRRLIDRLNENNVVGKLKDKKSIKFSTLAVIALIVLGVGFIITIALNNSTGNSGKVEVTATKPAAPTSTAEVNLILTGVGGKSWVGITDSGGEQVFDGQIKSGESQNFKNSNSLNVIIGNGAAIKVSLNGTDLGIAGGYGEVVHVNYTSSGAVKQ